MRRTNLLHAHLGLPDSSTSLVSKALNSFPLALIFDLVRSNINASGKELSDLLTKLVEESGNPRWACRRFVRRMGVKSRRPYRVWSQLEQQRLLKLIDLHPIGEVAKLMRRS